MASGQISKARDIIAAIRTLKTIEQAQRPATSEEKQILSRFSGFGPVALSMFPDPVSGNFRDASWKSIGEELQSLLTPQEYDSARRTTFNAFYTSPVVIDGIHEAIGRLGVPDHATILEPGCGVGNFLGRAKDGNRFIGVELDAISGRLARALYPEHDIRIENFRDTKLPEGRLDAVVGNVPFADVKLDYQGQKYSLHDYFFAKSIDALKPGGVLALVTSHYTLDKQNAAIREYLAGAADFVGAIRLPSDAFKREGTAVVTDIIFLRKRAPGEPAAHVDDGWLSVSPLTIEGRDVSINTYFHHHPEMVLGNWTTKDTLYGGQGYSVKSNGDLEGQLKHAIKHLPAFAPMQPSKADEPAVPAFVPPPPEKHIAEGSFFLGDDKAIYQIEAGQSQKVVYGGKELKGDGTMTGKRMAALIELRDKARRVLQSQNEGWPESTRIPIGRFKGLQYGLIIHPLNPPDVYLEGAMTRVSGLSKEHQGPRAVLNALERLSASYHTESARLSDDVAIYESQLADYQAKLGETFAHDDYLGDLTRLRDKLKAALSKRDNPNDATKTPSSGELARQIKELTASYSVDTHAARTDPKRLAAEEPVTAKIRKRQELAALHEADPPNSPEAPPGPFSERILRERAFQSDGHSPA